MLAELLINIATKMRPLRYAVEGAIYRTFYSPAEPEFDFLSWKDKFKGRPMLVVGNGPSLNQTPLEEFKDIPAIGMNKIDLLFSRSSWRPSVIMCTNDSVVQQHWKQWLTLNIPVFLNWKSRWFVPGRERAKFGFFSTRNEEDFAFDFDKGVGRANTVTYVALQFAYWCGADPVVIFGVDHNFVQGDKADLYERRVGEDVNHFDPNYFAAGTVWGTANLPGNERNYGLSLEAFHKNGRKIYDATIGGKLQVFPKISLDEARAILAAAPGP